MPLVALDLVPPPRQWLTRFGSWRGNIFEVDRVVAPDAPILESPDFELEGNKLVTLCFSAYFGGHGIFNLHVVEGARKEKVHSRLYKDVAGQARMSVAFRAPATGKYRIVIEHVSRPTRARITIVAPAFLAQGLGDGRVARGRVADLGQAREDSEDERYLPHWNSLQRYIHRRCRASRGFNRLVAAIEMRLERQEVLSLPQYMGLCPTGQCNATCDFCSVTINRTGIIKKQLPYERLENFLAPVVNTIQQFGIEGNGEPTLYTRFPELVERLTRGRANAYLITNGSRLKLDDAPILLALEAVNFSLNAATAETHQRVMKLKNFDEIITLIRSLARERGLRRIDQPREPSIYVTFVVTHDNVHEVQDFVRLAEQDLGADVVMVRPLAELGNELGVVEDLRRIVPYESDVQDMIESVREYVRDVAGGSEIRLAPETFRSSRPDPVGRVVMPRGFEGRLLAPRRNDWRMQRSDIDIEWSLNTARIILPATKEELLRSQPIPVEPGRELVFKAQVGVSGGSVRVVLVDGDDRVVIEALLADTGGRMIPLELLAPTRQGRSLSIVLAGEGRASTIQIDFERLRTPAPYVENEFQIPAGRRWETCTPGASVNWHDGTLAVRSPMGGSPYLLKSYAVPCAPETIVEIPVDVDVSSGSIDIGVLDASGASYLQTFSFAEGHSQSSIFFNTGANDVVRLVVSAAPNRLVDARIGWRKPQIIAGDSNEGAAIPLPSAPEWAACVRDLRLERSSGRLSISWDGTGSPYLLKSNKVRCRPGQQASMPIAVEVREGELGIGVVGAGGAGWLMMRTFVEGVHHIDLDFNTSANHEVSFVLFAIEGASVVARIGLSDDALAGDPPSSFPPSIDFERPRLPTSFIGNEFRVPPAQRWEICATDATVGWDNNLVTVHSATGGRPYLLKSAAIRCAQDTLVEIPVQVGVSRGAIEIGVLTASGGAHVQTFRFAEGQTTSSVFFNTGANSAVRLLVSANPGQLVDAAIQWGQPRLAFEEHSQKDEIHVPNAPEWTACVPEVRVDRSEDRLSLAWNGAGSPYLLKSNTARCGSDRQAKAQMIVEVSQGSVGVGVLAADGAAWLMTQRLGEGTHRVELGFGTGANSEVSFVLFAVEGAAVVASVVFAEKGVWNGEVLAAATQSELVEALVETEAATRMNSSTPPSTIDARSSGPIFARAEIAMTAAAESSVRQVVADISLEPAPPASLPPAATGIGRAKDGDKAQSDNLFRQAMKWARGKGVRYYCQKPWTDMSNFTVDGRMDVCCIATGASQEAYQLGNINKQSFQETWNGPMAREFRRTVNSDNKLPPCARCPMSHAYNGLLFDPENTRDAMNVKVFRILRKLKLSILIDRAALINQHIVDGILFKGFKSQRNRTI